MSKESIEDILKEIGSEDVPTDVHKLAEDTATDFDKTLLQAKKLKHYILWENITKSRITELAAAAAIFIAVGIFIGRWSKPTPPPHSLHVTSFTSAVSMYPAANKTEDSFWRKKALAAMQPRPYPQTLTTKTSLLNTYKQYLKEKYYD